MRNRQVLVATLAPVRRRPCRVRTRGAASAPTSPSPAGSTSATTPGAAARQAGAAGLGRRDRARPPQRGSGRRRGLRRAAPPPGSAAAPAGPAWYDELANAPKDISTNFWLPKNVNKEGKNADQMFIAVLALSIFFFVAIAVAVDLLRRGSTATARST